MKYFKSVSMVASLLTAGLITLSALPAAAAASTLSLSPASGSIVQGSSKTVSVIEDGDSVNAVTVHLSYDASKLSCNGIGGGNFGAEVSATCGGGTVTISRYVPAGSPALNGAQVVGTVNFGALAGSGSTSVTFGSSQVASNGVNTLGGTSGGTYTLTAPVSGGQGGGGTTTTGGGSTGGHAAAVAGSAAAVATANGQPNSSNTSTAASTNGATNSTAQAAAADSANKNNKKHGGGVNGTSTPSNTDTAKKAGFGVLIALLLAGLAAAGYYGYRRYYKGTNAKTTPVVAASVTKVKSLVAKKKPNTKKTTRKPASKKLTKKS